MSTDISPEITKRSPYWIPRHRFYELKHFCLQYPDWIKERSALLNISSLSFEDILEQTSRTYPMGVTSIMERNALDLYILNKKINMIENTAYDAGADIGTYILSAVTSGVSYTKLKTKLNMPCDKDYFYEHYRKFFWMLSECRE